MSESVTMVEVNEATLELIRAVGRAQRGWVASRPVTDGLVERLAVHACYRALYRAFIIDGLEGLSDEDVAFVNRVSDGIEITTAPASDESKARA